MPLLLPQHPSSGFAGFEKECQDFLQMIQEDGGAAPDLSFLDTICSSDMTGTSTSSMLSSGEDSIGRSQLADPCLEWLHVPGEMTNATSCPLVC